MHLWGKVSSVFVSDKILDPCTVFTALNYSTAECNFSFSMPCPCAQELMKSSSPEFHGLLSVGSLLWVLISLEQTGSSLLVNPLRYV